MDELIDGLSIVERRWDICADPDIIICKNRSLYVRILIAVFLHKRSILYENERSINFLRHSEFYS